jgi:hypothetical protein
MHMKKFKMLFCGLVVLTGMPVAHALTYVGELRTPYVINVTVDPKAATLPDAKPYLEKATKLIGTNFQVAEFEESLSIKKDGTYSVRSIIPTGSVVSTVTPLDKVVRMGDGKVVNGRPIAAKVVEQRGSNEPTLLALINDKLNKVFYYRGKENVRTEGLPAGGVADIVMLGYLYLGQPVPIKNVTLSATDARRPFVNQTLKATETPITFAGETFPGVKFTRVLTPGEDATLEFWVRKSDGLPVRTLIGLSGKYGVTIDIYPRKLHPVLTQK